VVKNTKVFLTYVGTFLIWATNQYTRQIKNLTEPINTMKLEVYHTRPMQLLAVVVLSLYLFYVLKRA